MTHDDHGPHQRGNHHNGSGVDGAATELHRQLATAMADAANRITTAILDDTLDRCTRDRAQNTFTHIYTGPPDEGWPLATIAELAVALRDSDIRDLMFALPYTEYAATADALWSRMSSVLPAPYGADPATLLAYSAYVNGDDLRAGAALDVALAADDEHRIARNMRLAVDNHDPGARWRALAEHARESAAEMGITITFIK
ncbi:DUF4192 family protein [Nocardia tengchongensis]|uniref:DUF4192 family protein n=1 Tax=Nocardia tengchongensis TaxID=2055889 RepID=UPI003646C742